MGADAELGPNGNIVTVEFDADTTDEDLEILASIPTVEDVIICDTQVTDDGLSNLEGLTNLKAVDIRGTKMSKKALEKLVSDLSGVEIESDAEPDEGRRRRRNDGDEDDEDEE